MLKIILSTSKKYENAYFFESVKFYLLLAYSSCGILQKKSRPNSFARDYYLLTNDYFYLRHYFSVTMVTPVSPSP